MASHGHICKMYNSKKKKKKKKKKTAPDHIQILKQKFTNNEDHNHPAKVTAIHLITKDPNLNG
jgi:hypothetical protein